MTFARFYTRVLTCLLAGLGLATGADAASSDLTVSPHEVVFTDAYSGRQLLVSQGQNDLTRAARYSSSDPAVVRIDDRGYLRPAGDGAAQVIVRHGAAEACVTVCVSGFRSGRAIDFGTEIGPLLSRLGCNAGGCH